MKEESLASRKGTEVPGGGLLLLYNRTRENRKKCHYPQILCLLREGEHEQAAHSAE